jgi:diguanylate cyclase (GGDEF)-like protein/PAS domain S-box-containing protein
LYTEDARSRAGEVLAGLVLALALAGSAVAAAVVPAPTQAPAGVERTQLPRHPLEDRALVEPDEVLRLLPPLIEQARVAADSHQLALLYLAQANACRVIADWRCQRDAGAAARKAAQAAGQPILLVRALVSESRALIAVQDFTRGEQLLGEAELVLKGSPSPELSADVSLAYSSLSFALGKLALSAEYAERGLAVLPGDLGLPTQARLLRNLARAQAQQGQKDAAEHSLQRGRALAERINDPKLSAEIWLGDARQARANGDIAAQRRSGERVLALGARLKNSQLGGMGHEVLGLAALDQGDRALANGELRQAYDSFRALGMKRDELRVLHELLRVAIAQKQAPALINSMALRFLDIDGAIERSDRAKAADDFDARLEYAERELDVLRLKDEAVLAGERERALAERNRQSQALTALVAAMLLVLGAFLLLQRRSNRRLQSTLALLRESEAQANDLLNLSAGFVFLHDLRGRLVRVNPAAAQALGQPVEALVGRLLQDFQPRVSRDGFAEYLHRVQVQGEDQGVFLVRSGEGDNRHWRYSSRLSAAHDGRAYAVGHAVDVTDQVQQTRVLHEQSVRDALTGTYNRRQLEICENSHPGDRPWAAISVDLDHFKQVNDTQGHDRGDLVLMDVARFLLERVRATDVVIRLGGDEFVVLLPFASAEMLRASVERLLGDAPQAPCAFSVGSALRAEDEPLSATIARADAAMYAARAIARAPESSSAQTQAIS